METSSLKCTLSDPLTAGDHSLKKGQLLPFETIGRPNTENSDMENTREFVKRTGKMMNALAQRVTEQSALIAQGKASKRQQTSFYRLLGSLDTWMAIGIALSLISEAILWRMPVVVKSLPMKLFVRWVGVIDKLSTLFTANQWEKALETIHDIWKETKKKLESVL